MGLAYLAWAGVKAFLQLPVADFPDVISFLAPSVQDL